MSLNTKNLINCLIREGYTHLCVVPCSFAKNLINECINNDLIEYLPAANEAVACSIAAGLKMSRQKPIVIVQSSGLSNMVSCLTSLVKPYGINFPIIVSWRTYKEGDSEIQHKHLSTELPNLIKSLGYDYKILNNQDLEKFIDQLNYSNKVNLINILEKDTFDETALLKEHQLNLSEYIPRSYFLTSLNENFKDKNVLFIGTTGNTSREMYKFMTNTNNFYMAGNMGGALSLGAGAALSGKTVIVCGGDAEFTMHMGGLSTVGRYANLLDLTYILFDNQQNKSTGGQQSYQNHLSYIKIAKNSGFQVVNDPIHTIKEFDNEVVKTGFLKFIHVKCNTDMEVSRPPLSKIMVNEFR